MRCVPDVVVGRCVPELVGVGLLREESDWSVRWVGAGKGRSLRSSPCDRYDLACFCLLKRSLTFNPDRVTPTSPFCPPSSSFLINSNQYS
jgi:hypothetical protein